MKLPITDEFLWELFHLSQKTEDIFRFFGLGPLRDTFVPPHFSIRRIYEKRKARQSFSEFIHYLTKKGYIEVKTLKPKGGIIITKKGLEKILRVSLKKTEKKKRGDGKWLMVIFDIPESKKALRNLLRRNLQFLGFVFFQKSIWVCPFDVLRETQVFISRFGLEKYIRIFLIEEMELKR